MNPEERRNYTNAWRAKRKADAVSKLGGICAWCGSKETLEFDHIDPATKVTQIANMWTASKVKFESELSKCQLLCRPCHIIKSSKEIRSDCPSFARYDTGCRCEPCRKLVGDYKRSWAFKKKLGSA